MPGLQIHLLLLFAVLHPVPNPANFYHAWLTASLSFPVWVHLPTEDGDLNKHTPKHLFSKSSFSKKAVGM